MRVPLFLVAAVVLIVFAIIGSAATTGECLGITWTTWLCSSFLAFLTNLIFGGWGYSNGAWGRDAHGNPVP